LVADEVFVIGSATRRTHCSFGSMYCEDSGAGEITCRLRQTRVRIRIRRRSLRLNFRRGPIRVLPSQCRRRCDLARLEGLTRPSRRSGWLLARPHPGA
jgi:hypothetical protein